MSVPIRGSFFCATVWLTASYYFSGKCLADLSPPPPPQRKYRHRLGVANNGEDYSRFWVVAHSAIRTLPALADL